MPTKTWVVGEEVLAADFNTYVQQQVVPTFSNTAARDAWTSPPNGARCVTLDTYTGWERRAGAWKRSAAGGLYSDWSNATVESGDIGSSPVIIRNPTINVESGRLYQVISTCSVISRSSGSAWLRLIVGGAHLNSALSPPGWGANAALLLSIAHTFTASSTGPVLFLVDLLASAGAVRYMAGNGFPMGITVTDLGPQ